MGNFAPSLRGPVSAGARFIAFLAWTLLLLGIWLPLRRLLRGLRRNRTGSWFTQAWSRGMLRILGLKVIVRGTPPEGSFFLVTNHLGYLDIAVLASKVRATFVSRADVAGWPIFGTMATSVDTVYLDRARKGDALRANASIASLLGMGGSVTVFPEGTSSGGEEVLPFHSSLLAYPAGKGIPIHYAALRYRAPADLPPAALSMCWWAEMEFFPHFFNLFRMRRMEAVIAFGDAPVREHDRKALAGKLRSAVAGRLASIPPDRRDASLPIPVIAEEAARLLQEMEA